MIVDLILNRKDDDELISQGYTHKQYFNGIVAPLAYDPRKFYYDLIGYGPIGEEIARAMDAGTEDDVKRELCEYITANDYNPEICDYIRSRDWLTA